MKSMTKLELKKLENIQHNIQITLYLPLLPGPENTAKNVSMLHHAVSLLRKTYTDIDIPKSSQNLIKEHVNVLEQELTHSQSGKSLAVFITETNDMLMYELPFDIETAIYFMVPHLQLEPLKAHYRQNTNYWVLSLSQKGCKLFKGIGDTLQQVAAKDISLDLKSMLRLDDVNAPEIQSHSIGVGSDRANESFHGHGGFKDIKKKYLEQYFRIIDKKLQKYIYNETAPLYVVGVDYSKALFKRISNRKNVVISGNLGTNMVTTTSVMHSLAPVFADVATA